MFHYHIDVKRCFRHYTVLHLNKVMFCLSLLWFNLNQSNANQLEHAEAEYYPSKIQSFRSKYIISNFLFRFSKQTCTTFWNASIVPCWRIIYPFLAIWMTVEFDIAYQFSNFLHICSSNSEGGDSRN